MIQWNNVNGYPWQIYDDATTDENIYRLGIEIDYGFIDEKLSDYGILGHSLGALVRELERPLEMGRVVIPHVSILTTGIRTAIEFVGAPHIVIASWRRLMEIFNDPSCLELGLPIEFPPLAWPHSLAVRTGASTATLDLASFTPLSHTPYGGHDLDTICQFISLLAPWNRRYKVLCYATDEQIAAQAQQILHQATTKNADALIARFHQDDDPLASLSFPSAPEAQGDNPNSRLPFSLAITDFEQERLPLFSILIPMSANSLAAISAWRYLIARNQVAYDFAAPVAIEMVETREGICASFFIPSRNSHEQIITRLRDDLLFSPTLDDEELLDVLVNFTESFHEAIWMRGSYLACGRLDDTVHLDDVRTILTTASESAHLSFFPLTDDDSHSDTKNLCESYPIYPYPHIDDIRVQRSYFLTCSHSLAPQNQPIPYRLHIGERGIQLSLIHSSQAKTPPSQRAFLYEQVICAIVHGNVAITVIDHTMRKATIPIDLGRDSLTQKETILNAIRSASPTALIIESDIPIADSFALLKPGVSKMRHFLRTIVAVAIAGALCLNAPSVAITAVNSWKASSAYRMSLYASPIFLSDGMSMEISDISSSHKELSFSMNLCAQSGDISISPDEILHNFMLKYPDGRLLLPTNRLDMDTIVLASGTCHSLPLHFDSPASDSHVSLNYRSRNGEDDIDWELS